MVLNSVKSIIIGTYTAISAFLGTKKIFPNTSSYISTYYSQSITPAKAITTSFYSASVSLSLIESKTTKTYGTGYLSHSHYETLTTKYISTSYRETKETQSSIYTSSTTSYISAPSYTVSEKYSYIRNGYTYYTASYATKFITATTTSSNGTIKTGGYTSGNYSRFVTASGTKQSYYTAQAAATYSRTTNQSSVNSRTTTTNGTFIKVSNKSYLTTLTSNV